MDPQELEKKLRDAQARLSKATKAVSRKHVGGEMEEWHAASDAVLVAERALAAANGDEYAVPEAFPLHWDVGAPCPHLLVNDFDALLAFYLRDVDPGWDGAAVHIRDVAADQQSIALVTFRNCLIARLGSPNDEVFDGHRLSGKGLESYTAQRVINSSWLEEIEGINRVHDGYNPASWKAVNHYVFWFHDTTFECLGSGYEHEVFNGTMPDVLAIACERLVR